MEAILTSTTADLLRGKIVSAIENEASLIGGLRDELDEINEELIGMRAFVQDAVNKGVLTKAESTWVASIRDLANEVEDVIDEFMYHMNKQHNGGKFTRLLYQTICLPNNLWVKHRIATKLQKIKKKIKFTDERRKRLAIERIEGRSSIDDQKTLFNYAESSFFIKEDKLVGIEDDNKLLVKWLMEEEQQCSTVISVVGMGGSGKTTLVSKAFNSRIVKRHFDCHAWITVSQKYVVDDLLRRMIEEFYKTTKEAIPTNLNTMRFRELVSTLLSYLETKRYLVVLDDVWSSGLWKEINVSLPDEGFGSRVILTTRDENIASSCFEVKSRVHHVKPMGAKEAWELFTMKAFSNNPGRLCPQELENLAWNLVNKCEGLPLALVALGSAMSNKPESEWEKVNKNLNFELRANSSLQKMKLILLLSFNELPYKLKHCFLYCCLFPEDFELKRRKLIRLWMAEGFVEKATGITPEEVAESYLMELIHRNMLQVVRRNPSGRPKRCKLHDLLREIALSIVATENFGTLYDDQEASEESGARRLSIRTITEQTKSLKDMSKLRSLLVFIDYRISPSLVTLPTGLRLLRVLDLEGAPIEKLPGELVDLFNLRYLSLRLTKVKELPKSIRRLSNLQTLDIARTSIKVLPTGITNLKNLRHLVMFRYSPHGTEGFEYYFGIRTPPNIHKLKNLQVLSCVEAESDLMRRIRSMTQLRRFSITKVREADEKDLCDAIQNMNLLRWLNVMVKDEAETLRMDVLTAAPPHLKSLLLSGKLEKMPHWFQSLRSLVYLELNWSRLAQDVIPFIKALPCLGNLLLNNAYSGKQLRCDAGFQKLKTLFLKNLPQLQAITIERGVMPDLDQLIVERCMELKTLPHGIEYLTNLQTLELDTISSELIQQIHDEQSVGRPKVQHIPNIKHFYKSASGTMYVENLS